MSWCVRTDHFCRDAEKLKNEKPHLGYVCWAHLEPNWAHLETIWAHLGPPESIWGPLTLSGPVWGPSDPSWGLFLFIRRWTKRATASATSALLGLYICIRPSTNAHQQCNKIPHPKPLTQASIQQNDKQNGLILTWLLTIHTIASVGWTLGPALHA
jgi:hypothetical protein